MQKRQHLLEYCQDICRRLFPEASGFWKESYTVVGAGAGVAAALFGKDPSTPANRPGVSMSKRRTTLLSAAAALFLLLLAQSLSLLASWVLWLGTRLLHGESLCLSQMPLDCTPYPDAAAALLPFDFRTHLDLLCGSDPASISRKNEERKCQPFTGFDKDDDRVMADLPGRPLHVVNMAWNLVKGRRLAWQQRKAASFTMTPIFAGSDIAPDPSCVDVDPGGFRSIRSYGSTEMGRKPQPMMLGTAMAISGAAASPNMGYHSSPLVTFVMAFFKRVTAPPGSPLPASRRSRC